MFVVVWWKLKNCFMPLAASTEEKKTFFHVSFLSCTFQKSLKIIYSRFPACLSVSVACFSPLKTIIVTFIAFKSFSLPPPPLSSHTPSSFVVSFDDI